MIRGERVACNLLTRELLGPNGPTAISIVPIARSETG